MVQDYESLTKVCKSEKEKRKMSNFERARMAHF